MFLSVLTKSISKMFTLLRYIFASKWGVISIWLNLHPENQSITLCGVDPSHGCFHCVNYTSVSWCFFLLQWRLRGKSDGTSSIVSTPFIPSEGKKENVYGSVSQFVLYVCSDWYWIILWGPGPSYRPYSRGIMKWPSPQHSQKCYDEWPCKIQEELFNM